MLWELLRNIGLITFIAGGFVLLGLSTIHRTHPYLPHVELIKNIADGMMLGGACLAVIAMSTDYLLSGIATTPLTPP